VSRRTVVLTDAVYEYLLAQSLREPALLAELRDETAKDPLSRMQIAPEQGQFMGLLVQLMGARRALELGVYTGYSALCVALALPPGGLLVACDINDAWTAVARRYWEAAGVADRITLHLEPALDLLDRLLASDTAPFDFAFIDAEKTEYIDYYERVLQLLRPGGVVAVDNTLWYGRVADPAEQDRDTQAIRAFNEHLRADQRVTLSLVPIGDGLTLAVKRE
jgi:caffeoyl-CoA O-methyltransferase